GTLSILFKTICDGDAECLAKSLTCTECYLVFTCAALLIAQLPNLYSIAWVATTAILYNTLIWILSITKDRPIDISYSLFDRVKSNMVRFSDALDALGFIAIAFRGHNVILKIQGTLPSSPKKKKHPISLCAQEGQYRT
ncbi:lysine histidine transporter-like 8, partial [Quercus suber]